MSNLLLLAHPGSHHSHPHDSNWLAVMLDNPLATIAFLAVIGVLVGLAWHALERRRS